jgi:hypothetical protein
MDKLTFKGTYVFKQNNVEIGRSENLITTNGRKVLLQYLVGTRTNWAADMAIGAINNSVNVSDVELNFETGRYPVSLKTYISANQTNPDLIVVRATLPSSLYANIYEIGLYPDTRITNVANRNDKILTDFSDLTNWVTSIANENLNVTNQGNTYITGFSPQGTASPRIGGFSVDLEPNTKYENNSFAFSLEGYTDLDTLQILAYNTASGVVTVKMKDILENEYSFNYTLSANGSYQILSVPFPANINFADTINSVSITTNSTASLTIDAIKTSVTNELTNEDYIISKSILTTPIAKVYGTPLDIEYYVQVL